MLKVVHGWLRLVSTGWTLVSVVFRSACWLLTSTDFYRFTVWNTPSPGPRNKSPSLHIFKRKLKIVSLRVCLSRYQVVPRRRPLQLPTVIQSTSSISNLSSDGIIVTAGCGGCMLRKGKMRRDACEGLLWRRDDATGAKLSATVQIHLRRRSALHLFAASYQATASCRSDRRQANSASILHFRQRITGTRPWARAVL